MKFSKQRLKQIIKEELSQLMEADQYGFEDEDEDTEEDEWGPRAMQPDANDLDDMHRMAASDRLHVYQMERKEFIDLHIGPWEDLGANKAEIEEALEEAYDKLSEFEEY